MEEGTSPKLQSAQVSKKFNAKALRLSLKYRPKIYRLILKLRLCIREKNNVIKELKQRLTELENPSGNPSSKQELNKESKDCHTQTTEKANTKDNATRVDNKNSMWGDGDADKSIADQVKEVAQSALQQNGMVYVESAGMYYDYKTGYYYNSELGLYYHNDTGCYYYYSEEQKNFVFHSYPDRNALAANASLIAHEKKKARKQMKERKAVESVKELTKSLSKGKEAKPNKAKKRKMTKKKTKSDGKGKQSPEKVAEDYAKVAEDSEKVENEKPETSINEVEAIEEEEEKEASNGIKRKETPMEVDEELEDGECSDTQSEDEGDDDEGQDSEASTSTVSDDDVISKHHPPCMRVIVRETSLPRLRVGTLYLVTKDGGTLGREGDHHAVLIQDTNVSRNHLELKYDSELRSYTVTDLGSKNGTVLNGQRISESLVPSQPVQVMHGSVLQVGETKLLCHVHAGSDTCGHCEPGLVMDTEEKQQKSAYTRTCSKEKQYQLELARLKNKYGPQPLMIEETEYNDRAERRRREHGSSHSAEKTHAGDLNTEIAADNKGFKLLQKMGWSKGEGLGKEGQGNPEPIPLVSNEGKAGLGTAGGVRAPAAAAGGAPPPPPPRARLGPATMRLAAATKMLQPPAKAFQDDDDDEDDAEGK